MKSFKNYILNWIIGVFPFLAIAYHLFLVQQVYKLKGIFVAIIALFTPLVSDVIIYFYTLSHYGFHKSHMIGIVGIIAGIIWYYKGRNALQNDHQ